MLEMKSGLEKNTEKQSLITNLPAWKVILKPRASVPTQLFEKEISVDSEGSRQSRFPNEQLRLFRHSPVNYSGSFKLSGYQRFRYLYFLEQLQLFSV